MFATFEELCSLFYSTLVGRASDLVTAPVQKLSTKQLESWWGFDYQSSVGRFGVHLLGFFCSSALVFFLLLSARFVSYQYLILLITFSAVIERIKTNADPFCDTSSIMVIYIAVSFAS